MNRQMTALATKTFTRSILSLLFVFLLVTASAQPGTEKGLPFIKNYTYKMYDGNGQNWSIVQDNSGIMYFANAGKNGKGLGMSYDGVTWNKILSSGNKTFGATRCLVKDKDGVIYYGSVGDFGYYGHDSIGQTRAYSLLKYVPKDKRNFFDTWSAQITEKGIYFQSRERLFRLTKTGTGNQQQWTSKTWEPATHFLYSFYLDGTLYVHEQEVGLLKMVNDSLILIPGSEFLGKTRVQVMLPYHKNATQNNASTQKQYLIGAMNGSLYIFDGKKFMLFKTDADNILKSGLIYKGIIINGNYVLATTGKGVVIINPEGKIQQVINRSSGLQNETIYSVYLDDAGDLWLGLNNGISKVDINSPFTKFGIESGITSSVSDMIRLPDGSLYLGTVNGLLKYDLSTSKFEIVKGVALNQIFQLLADGNTLLVPTDGLYIIKDDKPILIRSSVAGNLQVVPLAISKRYPNILYAGTAFGISLFLRDSRAASGWKYLGELPDIKEGIWSFAEKEDGQMWAGTQGGGTYLITLSLDKNGQPDLSKTEIKVFGKKQGFKTPFLGVFELNHTIYFGADSATYTFNEKQNKFEKATFQGLTNFSGVKDSTGKLWLVAGTIDNPGFIIATPQPDHTYQIDSTSLLPIIDISGGGVYPDINDIAWFSSSDGLI